MTPPRPEAAPRPAAGAELPGAFERRMRRLLGDAEAERLFRALAAPPARGLRVHPGRTETARLAELTGWRLEPLPWTPHAAVLDAGDVAPGRHPLHEAGAFYLQDPSATVPAAALRVVPGERVIDLAAAPGGKATQLACDLRGEGLLVANDVAADRLPALARNLERFGARNAVVTQEPPAALARRWPGAFDAVLLDAPCSGEGMFRKSEEALRAWSEAAVRACAVRQTELLDAAADLLAPGGRLAYATCTFAPEENEGVVAGLLRRRPELRPLPVNLPGLAPGRPADVGASDVLPPEACGRAWPHRGPGDGHFVALLQRRPEAVGGPGAPDPGRDRRGDPLRTPRRRRPRHVRRGAAVPADAATLAAWGRFAAAALRAGALPEADRPDALIEAGGLLWARAAGIDVGGVRVLRPGLALGRPRPDGRFEPAHALAQALRPDEARRRLELDPSGPTAARWLAGEELEATLVDAPDATLLGPRDGGTVDGHVLVTVAGAPLGWALRRGRRLRNLYPKGLRRRS